MRLSVNTCHCVAIMGKGAYYNENEPYAAAWLRNLCAARLIPDGDVDERSICDVRSDDLRGYAQCHFFAGIGGWAYAARLAGWPDDCPIWTGSCPCQPFSVAGKRQAQSDERHLWPIWFDLIRKCRPSAIFGEQVASAIGHGWLDGVCTDLEGEDYACGAAVLPACAVDAPHKRDRLWFVANDASGTRGLCAGQISAAPQSEWQDRGCGCGASLADTSGKRCGEAGKHQFERSEERIASGSGLDVADTSSRENRRLQQSELAPDIAADGMRDVAYPDFTRSQIGQCQPRNTCTECSPALRNGRRSAWNGAEWLRGADGKARRVEPGLRLLAHGVSARVGRLRAYGNAIVPQVAAKVISAFMDREYMRGCE